eukprot:TRINITY_DN16441_c0_g2_i1.p1 TRINITY_DN16441_c0_g2~~TRINITY_DN16441_c0_g2_i1.p1  ORF type:complete len:1864 (+),score=354.60 TRINITY_DN16441_c0_g2_i1:74-5665(+)
MNRWKYEIDNKNKILERSLRRVRRVTRLLKVGDYVCRPHNEVGEVVAIGEARQCGGTRLVAFRRLAHIERRKVNPSASSNNDGRLFEFVYAGDGEKVTVLPEKCLQQLCLGSLSPLPGNVCAVIMEFLDSDVATPVAVTKFLNHPQQPCPSILRLVFAKCWSMTLRCSKPLSTIARNSAKFLTGEKNAAFLDELQGEWQDISKSALSKDKFTITGSCAKLPDEDGFTFSCLPCGMVQKESKHTNSSLLLTITYTAAIWSDGSVWKRSKRSTFVKQSDNPSQLFIVQKYKGLGTQVGPLAVLPLTDGLLEGPAVDVIPLVKSQLGITSTGILQTGLLKGKTLSQMLDICPDAGTCRSGFVPASGSHKGKSPLFGVTLLDKSGQWQEIMQLIDSNCSSDVDDDVFQRIDNLFKEFGTALFQKTDPIGRTLLDVACCKSHPCPELIKKLCSHTVIATVSSTRLLPLHLICGHVRDGETAWKCVEILLKNWPPLVNNPCIALSEDTSGNTFIDTAVQWHSSNKTVMHNILLWYNNEDCYSPFRSHYRLPLFEKLLKLAKQDVDSLILSGVDLNPDSSGQNLKVVDNMTLTFMQKSILHQNLEAAASLSSIDGMLTKCDWRGWIPSHYLSSLKPTEANSELYNTLLHKTCHLFDTRDTAGRTPVLIGCMEHNVSFVNFFLSAESIPLNLKAQILLTPDHVGSNCIQFLIQVKDGEILKNCLETISSACQEDFVVVNTESDFPKTLSMVSTNTAYSQEELPFPDATSLLLSATTLNWKEGIDILLSSFVVEQQLKADAKELKSRVLQHAVDLSHTDIQQHLISLGWEIIPKPPKKIQKVPKPLRDMHQSIAGWLSAIPADSVLDKVLGALIGEETVEFDIRHPPTRHFLIAGIEHEYKNTVVGIIARLCVAVMKFGEWNPVTAESLRSAAKECDLNKYHSSDITFSSIVPLDRLMEIAASVGTSGVLSLMPSFSTFNDNDWHRLSAMCLMRNVTPFKKIFDTLPNIITNDMGHSLLLISILDGTKKAVEDLSHFSSNTTDASCVSLSVAGHLLRNKPTAKHTPFITNNFIEAAAVRCDASILDIALSFNQEVTFRAIELAVHSCVISPNKVVLCSLVQAGISQSKIDVHKLMEYLITSPLRASLINGALSKVIDSDTSTGSIHLSESVVKWCSSHQKMFPINRIFEVMAGDDISKGLIVSLYLRSSDCHCLSELVGHFDMLTEDHLASVLSSCTTSDAVVDSVASFLDSGNLFSLKLVAALATRSIGNSFNTIVSYDRNTRFDLTLSKYDDSVLCAALKRGCSEFIPKIIDDIFGSQSHHNLSSEVSEKIVKQLIQIGQADSLKLFVKLTNHSYVDKLIESIPEYTCLSEYCIVNGHSDMLLAMAECKVFKEPFPQSSTLPEDAPNVSSVIRSLSMKGKYDYICEIARLRKREAGNWDFTSGFLSALRKGCRRHVNKINNTTHFEYDHSNNQKVSCADMYQLSSPKTILETYLSASKSGNESKCLSLQSLADKGQFYESETICREVIDHHIRNNRIEALKAFLSNTMLPPEVSEGWNNFIYKMTDNNNENLSLLSYANLIATPECISVVKSLCAPNIDMDYQYCSSPFKLYKISLTIGLPGLVGSWCPFPGKSSTHKVLPSESPSSRYLYDYSKLSIDKSSRCFIMWKSNSDDAAGVVAKISHQDQRSFETVIGLGSESSPVLKFLSDKARRSYSGEKIATGDGDEVVCHSDYEYVFSGKLNHNELTFVMDPIPEIVQLYPVDPSQLEDDFMLTIFCPGRSSNTEMVTSSESEIWTPLGLLPDEEPTVEPDLFWWKKDTPAPKPHRFKHRKETRKHKGRVKEIQCFQLWFMTLNSSALALGKLATDASE